MRLQSGTPNVQPRTGARIDMNGRCSHGAVEKTVLGAVTSFGNKMIARLWGC